MSTIFLPENTGYFPAREVVFFDVDAMSNEITAKRLNIIERLLNGEKLAIVTTIDALMQKLPPVKMFENTMLTLSVNQEISIENLISHFVIGGYERVELVDSYGQFASRGGIIVLFLFR